MPNDKKHAKKNVTKNLSKGNNAKDANHENDNDPELQAELEMAKADLANGIAPHVPNVVPAKVVAEEKSDSKADPFDAAKKSPHSKDPKAVRKARARGVSGSSSKKDGGRFDMGFDNDDDWSNDFDSDSDWDQEEIFYDSEIPLADSPGATAYVAAAAVDDHIAHSRGDVPLTPQEGTERMKIEMPWLFPEAHPAP